MPSLEALPIEAALAGEMNARSAARSSLLALALAGTARGYAPRAYVAAHARSLELPRQKEHKSTPRRALELDLDEVLSEELGFDFVAAHSGTEQRFDHGYARATYDRDASVDVDAVDELLVERALLRQCRDFEAADGIHAQLRRLGVEVDDRRKTWASRRSAPSRFRPSRYAFAGDAAGLDRALLRTVTRILARRSEAQYQKDWVVADHYRDELRVNHGVIVDDRTKRWSVGSGYSTRDDHPRQP